MTFIRRSAIAGVLLATAMVSVGLGDTLYKQVNYSINVPYAVRMGDYLLPAGDYVLSQVDVYDPTLFALFPGRHMMHSPVAMIRTTRIYYPPTRTPQHTSFLLNIDETSGDAHPVLRGWTIPGESGWQIVAVVSSNKKVLTQTR